MLREAGIETPYIDAIVLLAFVSGVTKERVMASFPDPVDPEIVNAFNGSIQTRLSGYPVSYIRRRKEFYGREYYVDERVLVPRPATESLVEALLEAYRADSGIRSVHDACTGSGCVAISLKAEVPRLSVSASDSVPEVLPVFQKNCLQILGHTLPLFVTPFMYEIHELFDAITINPPYLTESEVNEMVARRWPEPENALRGGGDAGTDIPVRFIHAAMDKLRPDGYLFMEGAAGRMGLLADAMICTGYHSVKILKELSGCERLVTGRRGR